MERKSPSADWKLHALLLALLPLVTSGCAFMPISTGTFTTALDPWFPSSTRKLTEDEPRFHVELRTAYGGKTRKTYPLDRDLVIQDALDLSRATSKFGKMEVYVYRQNEAGHKVKFGADFDAGKRRMKFETDYAIHPGDTIVVTEDVTNPITESIDRLSGAGKSSRSR